MKDGSGSDKKTPGGQVDEKKDSDLNEEVKTVVRALTAVMQVIPMGSVPQAPIINPPAEVEFVQRATNDAQAPVQITTTDLNYLPPLETILDGDQIIIKSNKPVHGAADGTILRLSLLNDAEKYRRVNEKLKEDVDRAFNAMGHKHPVNLLLRLGKLVRGIPESERTYADQLRYGMVRALLIKDLLETDIEDSYLRLASYFGDRVGCDKETLKFTMDALTEAYLAESYRREKMEEGPLVLDAHEIDPKKPAPRMLLQTAMNAAINTIAKRPELYEDLSVFMKFQEMHAAVSQSGNINSTFPLQSMGYEQIHKAMSMSKLAENAYSHITGKVPAVQDNAVTWVPFDSKIKGHREIAAALSANFPELRGAIHGGTKYSDFAIANKGKTVDLGLNSKVQDFAIEYFNTRNNEERHGTLMRYAASDFAGVYFANVVNLQNACHNDRAFIAYAAAERGDYAFAISEMGSLANESVANIPKYSGDTLSGFYHNAYVNGGSKIRNFIIQTAQHNPGIFDRVTKEQFERMFDESSTQKEKASLLTLFNRKEYTTKRAAGFLFPNAAIGQQPLPTQSQVNENVSEKLPELSPIERSKLINEVYAHLQGIDIKVVLQNENLETRGIVIKHIENCDNLKGYLAHKEKIADEVIKEMPKEILAYAVHGTYQEKEDVRVAIDEKLKNARIIGSSDGTISVIFYQPQTSATSGESQAAKNAAKYEERMREIDSILEMPGVKRNIIGNVQELDYVTVMTKASKISDWYKRTVVESKDEALSEKAFEVMVKSAKGETTFQNKSASSRMVRFIDDHSKELLDAEWMKITPLKWEDFKKHQIASVPNEKFVTVSELSEEKQGAYVLELVGGKKVESVSIEQFNTAAYAVFANNAVEIVNRYKEAAFIHDMERTMNQMPAEMMILIGHMGKHNQTKIIESRFVDAKNGGLGGFGGSNYLEGVEEQAKEKLGRIVDEMYPHLGADYRSNLLNYAQIEVRNDMAKVITYAYDDGVKEYVKNRKAMFDRRSGINENPGSPALKSAFRSIIISNKSELIETAYGNIKPCDPCKNVDEIFSELGGERLLQIIYHTYGTPFDHLPKEKQAEAIVKAIMIHNGKEFKEEAGKTTDYAAIANSLLERHKAGIVQHLTVSNLEALKGTVSSTDSWEINAVLGLPNKKVMQALKNMGSTQKDANGQSDISDKFVAFVESKKAEYSGKFEIGISEGEWPELKGKIKPKVSDELLERIKRVITEKYGSEKIANYLKEIIEDILVRNPRPGKVQISMTSSTMIEINDGRSRLIAPAIAGIIPQIKSEKEIDAMIILITSSMTARQAELYNDRQLKLEKIAFDIASEMPESTASGFSTLPEVKKKAIVREMWEKVKEKYSMGAKNTEKKDAIRKMKSDADKITTASTNGQKTKA